MSTACIFFSLTASVCPSLYSVDNAVISRPWAFRHCSPQPSASVNGYTRRALHTCTRIPHLESVSQAQRYSWAGEHRSHFTVYPSFVIGSYGNLLVSRCLLQHTRERKSTPGQPSLLQYNPNLPVQTTTKSLFSHIIHSKICVLYFSSKWQWGRTVRMLS